MADYTRFDGPCTRLHCTGGETSPVALSWTGAPTPTIDGRDFHSLMRDPLTRRQRRTRTTEEDRFIWFHVEIHPKASQAFLGTMLGRSHMAVRLAAKNLRDHFRDLEARNVCLSDPAWAVFRPWGYRHVPAFVPASTLASAPTLASSASLPTALPQSQLQPSSPSSPSASSTVSTPASTATLASSASPLFALPQSQHQPSSSSSPPVKNSKLPHGEAQSTKSRKRRVAPATEPSQALGVPFIEELAGPPHKRSASQVQQTPDFSEPTSKQPSHRTSGPSFTPINRLWAERTEARLRSPEITQKWSEEKIEMMHRRLLACHEVDERNKELRALRDESEARSRMDAAIARDEAKRNALKEAAIAKKREVKENSEESQRRLDVAQERYEATRHLISEDYRRNAWNRYAQRDSSGLGTRAFADHARDEAQENALRPNLPSANKPKE